MPTHPPLGVTAVMLPELDFQEQIALCVELGVTHYTARPRVIPDAQRDKPWHSHGNHKFDLTPHRLIEEGEAMARQLEDAGMTAFGTVPALTAQADADTIKLHCEGAAKIGAGRMRMATGPYPTQVFDYAAALEQQVEQYGRAVDIAQTYGLKLVIETHSSSLAASPALAWNILKHFEPTQLGAIFDLPNFAREGNLVAHLAVSVLKDYIDHLHVGGLRRVRGEQDAKGFAHERTEMCGMKEGDLYIPGWLDLARQHAPDAPWVLEDYSAGLSGEQRLRRAVAEVHDALEVLG